MKFELLVAIRYLRAKRKQAVISLITFIAILGVGAGVAALVVAMAVSEGQREDIREPLARRAGAPHDHCRGAEGISNYARSPSKSSRWRASLVRRRIPSEDMAISFQRTRRRYSSKASFRNWKRAFPASRKHRRGQLSDLKEQYDRHRQGTRRPARASDRRPSADDESPTVPVTPLGMQPQRDMRSRLSRSFRSAFTNTTRISSMFPSTGRLTCRLRATSQQTSK